MTPWERHTSSAYYIMNNLNPIMRSYKANLNQGDSIKNIQMRAKKMAQRVKAVTAEPKESVQSRE